MIPTRMSIKNILTQEEQEVIVYSIFTSYNEVFEGFEPFAAGWDEKNQCWITAPLSHFTPVLENKRMLNE